ncbi:unnamed protein product [Echinostoma caproni]|uniref:Polycomb protein EED n=1 Tax=Echinostoma caproni TaxID=27848 RepID=A0A183A022_9TREM|nr:unnamed protein product [Echinostoma caproni]
MGSLKRHAISSHGIVLESAFMDNPEDKDFEAPVESNSDTDSGSSSSNDSTTKALRGRKRCPGKLKRRSRPATARFSTLHQTTVSSTPLTGESATVAAAAFPHVRRRRGRPRRSSARVIKSLDNHADLLQIDPIAISNQLQETQLSGFQGETRYRTILPRPPGGPLGDLAASRPIVVDRNQRRRLRRSKKLLQKPGTLAPLLSENSNPNRLPIGTALTLNTQSQINQTAYLDTFGIPAESYLTLDTSAYSTGACALDFTVADDSGQSNRKPPHVLTVAAAYASQLPPGSIPAASVEECEALLKSQSTVEGKTSGLTESSTPVHTAPMIPSIQIYPSTWMEGQQQAVATGIVASGDMSGVDGTVSQSVYEVSTRQNAAVSIPVAQPLHLFPVFGPDGMTVMYYMAAPVDIVQSPTSSVTAKAETTSDSTNRLVSCSTESGVPGKSCFVWVEYVRLLYVQLLILSMAT